MCKMLISVESGYELEALQREVGNVCEAMLAFPLRLPGTRFYKGLQVKLSIQMRAEIINGLFYSIPSLICRPGLHILYMIDDSGQEENHEHN